MEGITMASILTDVGTFFTQAITWMGDVVEFVVSNPMTLLLVIALPVSGYAIGAVKRLIRL